jgi:hypothetical protein
MPAAIEQDASASASRGAQAGETLHPPTSEARFPGSPAPMSCAEASTPTSSAASPARSAELHRHGWARSRAAPSPTPDRPGLRVRPNASARVRSAAGLCGTSTGGLNRGRTQSRSATKRGAGRPDPERRHRGAGQHDSQRPSRVPELPDYVPGPCISEPRVQSVSYQYLDRLRDTFLNALPAVEPRRPIRRRLLEATYAARPYTECPSSQYESNTCW